MFVPRSGSTGDLRLRQLLFFALAYLSLTFCTIIVVTAILLSLHPLSKQKTDRVSFRIMIYALCGSTVYSMATVIAMRAHSQTTCRIAGSFSVFALNLSSFLFFCIGLNLQLVMIHGIDGTKAEKYYVGGSLSLAVVTGVLTYSSRQLVYDSNQSLCYYYDTNRVRGFWWRMCTQTVWNFLTMSGEFITFTAVLIYMIRVKVFSSGPSRENTTTSSSSQGLSASRHYRKPLGPKQYRNVVLRIALYPLSSLATSGVMAIGVVYTPTSTVVKNKNITSALRVIYMSRGAIYALVAAADPLRFLFVDFVLKPVWTIFFLTFQPSSQAITQGLKVLYGHYIRRRISPPSTGILFAAPRPRSLVPQDPPGIELEELTHSKIGSLRRTPIHESRSSITLPSMPKPVVTSPNVTVVDSTSSYTLMDSTSSRSRNEDSVPYTYSQL
ncbi:hypothetical protein L218DRAFT_745693 [Marasmius fiardii PR-910]|nr:hypothetical protein L218DRAFT_745693 [Marasmius fiardii PR-910]